MSEAGLGVRDACEKKPARLEAIQGRLTEGINRLNGVIGRLDALCDRAFGAVDQPEDLKDNPPRDGTLGQVEDQLDRLDQAASNLESLEQRLREIV